MKINVVLCLCLLALCSCTEPGKTTGIGAAAGGVLGAGVGAIVGNQTGHPGSGLVIGAAAGAGAGAAVGNAFEAQEKVIATQEEALNKQSRQIMAQQGQIEELRNMSKDQVSYKGADNNFGNNTFNNTYNSGTYGNNLAANKGAGGRILSEPTYMPPSVIAYNRAHNTMDSTTTAVEEVKSDEGLNNYAAGASVGSFGSENTTDDMRGSYAWKQAEVQPKPEAVKVEVNEDNYQAPVAEMSDDCKEAESEASSARSVSSLADQLYHYRRALRLCPNNPKYHNEMGMVYMSLSREADAKFEFQEALKIDPNYSAARDNLNKVGSGRNY